MINITREDAQAIEEAGHRIKSARTDDVKKAAMIEYRELVAEIIEANGGTKSDYAQYAFDFTGANKTKRR